MNPEQPTDDSLVTRKRHSRIARLQAAQRRRRRFNTSVAVAVVLAVTALALGWRYSSRHHDPMGTGGQAAAATSASADSSTTASTTSIRATTQPQIPTPYFASYKKLRLRLPVSVDDLTEVGFHQASYSYALHLKTPLSYADMTAAKKDRGTHRDKSKQSDDPDATLVGEALKMWRNRPGKPDTAADVGADPGSDVFAPVSGTVVKVKKYELYGKYDDVEVHIQPAGYPTIDCVLIHLSDVTCEPGDVVEAGITRIAEVRKLPKAVGPQLRSYTKNGGYHTHIQLNDATDPEYEGLKGAITVTDSPAPEHANQ